MHGVWCRHPAAAPQARAHETREIIPQKLLRGAEGAENSDPIDQSGAESSEPHLNELLTSKIKNSYFDHYNEQRGAFTHHVFAAPAAVSTKHAIAIWRDETLCGRAFIVSPLFACNETIKELLLKMDTDFDKNPNDTKFLLFVPKIKNASWWHFICNYETLDTLSKNDGLFEDGSGIPHPILVMYRDINTPTRINPLVLLHLRFMHFSTPYIVDLWRKGVNLGVDLNDDIVEMSENYFCKSCKVRMQLQHVAASEQDFSNYEPFEFVCMDGTGPLPVESIHGNYYIWAIMCLKTRWVELYYSRNKDQSTVFVIFNEFLDYLDTRSKVIKNITMTKRLLTDLGGEFANKSMVTLCQKRKIYHEFAATRMHHMNAHVERYFKTLWSGLNRTLFTGDIPFDLWEEVCSHCCFLRNRIGYSTLDNFDNPYKILNGVESTDLKRCWIPYSQCWVVTDAYSPKFDAETDELRWLGIARANRDQAVRGAVVFRPSDRKIFVAGMLHVFENPTETGKLLNDRTFTAFDIQDSKEYKLLSSKPFISIEPEIKQFTKIVRHRSFFSEDDEQIYALVEIVTETQSTPYWTYLSTLMTSDSGDFDIIWKYCLTECHGEDFPLFSCIHVKGGRNDRPGIVCSYHKLNKDRLLIGHENQTAEFYPIKKISEFTDRDATDVILLCGSFSNQQIDKKYFGYVNPKDREEAKKRHDWPEWEIAEKAELKQFRDMKYLVDFTNIRPRGKYLHTMRLVYQIKIFTDGTLDKYKVRLVFRGFTMKKFRDFLDTYAPVTQLISMKLFFYFVIFYRLEHRVVDIKSAFLNATIDHDVWVEIPDGLEVDGCRFARVNKAIPGVKQGAHLWGLMFSRHLRSNGFKQNSVEPCLFMYFTSTVTCLILIHVDNCMVGCNNWPWFDKLMKEEWSKEFIAEYVSTSSILGLHVERIDDFTFEFSQKAYIEQTIAEFELQNEKPSELPMKPGLENEYDPETMSTSVDSSIPYRRLNMKIMWLARGSRNEIMYHAVFFSRFAHCYTRALYDEMLKILLYLKGTIDRTQTLIVDPDEEPRLHFVCDANFATYTNRKSTIGVLGFLNGMMIHASSSTSKTTLTSSSESESHSIFEAAKCAVYCKNWIQQFRKIEMPIFIFNDNTSAISIMSTRNNSGRAKHFSVKLRYVIELIEQGVLRIAYIDSNNNAADILTHSLVKAKWNQKLDLLYGSRISHSGGDSNYTSARRTRIEAEPYEVDDPMVSKLLSYLASRLYE